MKTFSAIKRATLSLVAIGLVSLGLATHAHAAALQGQLQIRPLTPQEVKDYGLTGVQTGSGLSTVAIGQPAYIDALINLAVTNTDNVTVDWSLTATPVGAAAVLTESPLGANVPPYKMADRLTTKVAGRTMIRPDLVGQYTISASITSLTSGSTNLTLTLTAGTYLGANTCALCHSGGLIASNTYAPWLQTAHASAFTKAIDGESTDHFTPNCIKCHVVGFDANTNSANGGFDDIAAQTGWQFPTTLTNGNWAAMPDALKNVSNVQCENCHGPGSQHASSFGNPNLITKTFISGDCAQCHDSLSHHYKTTEWNNSGHAIAPRAPSGPNNKACVRCHTAAGFAGYIANGGTNTYATNTVYEAITCAACHDPHDATNPHQLRAGTTITLGSGNVVANAGKGAFCMNCHQSRNGSVTNSLVNWPLKLPTWDGGSSFGLHDACQADMLAGVNGATYGLDIPSSAHLAAVTNSCVGCHMQTVASTDPAFTKAGGHTMKMSYDVVNNGVTNKVDLVDVCVKCHGPMDSFNMVKVDYNGDGIIEGVQTEVSKLKDKLSTLIPPAGYKANPLDYVADGKVKASTSEQTNWPSRFLSAAYNFRMVRRDASLGVHNAAYTVGLLKASIADLTGDSNNDGLSDAWQIQYFGSATSPSAAPNAAPAGDGVPNWLKFGLGLNPLVPGIVVPDGVVWANASASGGSTDTIRIYTAAEVVFDTEVGKSYQIESVSTLGGGWQKVGEPIPGTGSAISYVTPTRSNAQQYYRVSHTP